MTTLETTRLSCDATGYALEVNGRRVTPVVRAVVELEGWVAERPELFVEPVVEMHVRPVDRQTFAHRCAARIVARAKR